MLWSVLTQDIQVIADRGLEQSVFPVVGKGSEFLF
jgi:hypothetical protein